MTVGIWLLCRTARLPGQEHRGDMDSPISLELVYIETLAGFLLELVFFRLGPVVPARISIRLPQGGGSSSR